MFFYIELGIKEREINELGDVRGSLLEIDFMLDVILLFLNRKDMILVNLEFFGIS